MASPMPASAKENWTGRFAGRIRFGRALVAKRAWRRSSLHDQKACGRRRTSGSAGRCSRPRWRRRTRSTRGWRASKPAHPIATDKEILAMTDDLGSYALTRFNATSHGILARYTVLPWESGEEYGQLLAALVQEHQPLGPTEEHLVEEIAGVIWRKRRLRMAEGAAHRRRLERTFSPYNDTAKAALAHLGHTGEG